MKRPFLITALAALTIGFAPPATAAAGPVTGPPSFHERVVEDFVDDNFCGTGADVAVHFEDRATVWEREDAFKVTFNYKAWLDLQRCHVDRSVRRPDRRDRCGASGWSCTERWK